MRVRILCPLAAAAAMLAGPSAASAAFPHVVVRGESLSSVAAADGLTVRELAAANGLSPRAHLFAGSTLLIPPRCRSVLPHTATCPPAPPTTASGITAASMSHGDTHGAALRHCGRLRAVPAALAHAEAGGKLARGWTRGRGLGEQPPYQSVTPSPTGSIAANGVPSSFAEGVAGQMSGSNNSLVSSANARGVIQVVPITWNYVPITWNWIGNTFSGPTTPAAGCRCSRNDRRREAILPSPVSSGAKGLSSILPSPVSSGAKGLSSILPSPVSSGAKGLSSILPSPLSSTAKGQSSVRQNGPYRLTQYMNDLMALLGRFGGQ
jgi:N-acetylmuramoyl-L-alanine amidase